MTEFAQQVFEALGPLPYGVGETLAPRVAAAIEAAVASIDMGYYRKYHFDESTQPALAALRGEKP